MTVTWSLNPARTAARYEQGAAGIPARIRAMRTCADHGYRVGFHLDPVIRVPGWRSEYRELLDRVFCVMKPADIRYVSVGSLRFKRDLYDGLGAEGLQRFPAFLDEFIPGIDGKYRYFKPLRLELYRVLTGMLRNYLPRDRVRFCMEPAYIQSTIF